MTEARKAEPLFGKIALIGIGLIGGSIALAARRGGLAGRSSPPRGGPRPPRPPTA